MLFCIKTQKTPILKNDPGKYKTLEPLIRSLPEKPGIYQYLDAKGSIIYIGKAKNLKRRVSSYFNRDSGHSGKIMVMLSKIRDIRFMVVDTELDAFLLENNLIKKYQPRYNIQLKDDKSFPWICIKNEAFPRVFPTRHTINDGSEYFGPYASVKMMNTILELIRQLYPLRTCKYNLSPANINSGKYKRCLEYHLGNCKAPCEGLQTEEDYLKIISQIKDIIKGNINSVSAQLRELMQKHAEAMEYEKAHLIKERIHLLERYQSKSTIVNPAINDVDVMSLIAAEKEAYANYLKVMNGAIVQVHTIEIKKKLDESEEDLLAFAITDFRKRFSSRSSELLVSAEISMEMPGVKIHRPLRGDKKKLLDLSVRNARYYQMEKQKQRSLVDPERHSRRILESLQKDLSLSELPDRIECFDNSNFQGDYPVAAMVCFINARPAKKEYRHYNIKTVSGPDDYASMEEIIYRRYSRLLKEEKELPQLIVIDGGKGQLGAALKSLEKLKLRGKIAIIGIAKRLEEIYFPGDELPLYLDKKSESLKLIQYLRDEAHRFGITHHRNKRHKGSMKSILTEIPGIGPKIAGQLLKDFGSVKQIGGASLEDLKQSIGASRAATVKEWFRKSELDPDA